MRTHTTCRPVLLQKLCLAKHPSPSRVSNHARRRGARDALAALELLRLAEIKDGLFHRTGDSVSQWTRLWPGKERPVRTHAILLDLFADVESVTDGVSDIDGQICAFECASAAEPE